MSSPIVFGSSRAILLTTAYGSQPQQRVKEFKQPAETIDYQEKFTTPSPHQDCAKEQSQDIGYYTL